MGLERLRSIVPPPAEPLEAGAPDQWPRVEAELGTRLPDDFKRFTELYGSGKFDDFLYLLNPFAADPAGNLVAARDTMLAAYAETRAKFPDRLPLPPYPEPGGLLPLGRSDNGNELYWLTEGEPSSWAVVAFAGRSTRHEIHRHPVTRFLALLLSGALETKVFPDSFLRRGSHQFVPST
jgi:SMI1-KNR4 cell-wall